jgi:hypothetical protein
VPTIDGVIRSMLARSKDCDATLFVFDTATFDPPPGRSEFSEQHRFAEDLPKWIAAIRDEAPRPSAAPAKGATSESGGGNPGVWVAASTSARPVAVGASKWEAQVGGELHRDWWENRSFAGFDPAHVALPRLLAQLPGDRKALVLVTNDILPEQWIREPPFRFTGAFAGGESWRRKLSDIGEYWDAERVGSALAAAHSLLFVVAPESRFGDFLPLTDLPDAPWASRPAAMALASVPPVGTTPGAAGDSIEQMIAKLRAAGVPEDEIQKVVARIRGDAPATGHGKSGRFRSLTPLWFPSYGQQRFFNADSPSAYGFWPFARAAAKAGGLYCFYPFPPGDWADECPRDASLVDALEPELVPVAEFARLRQGDEALAAMIEAQELVFKTTPWTDGSRGSGTPGGASSWCGFEPSCNGVASRWRPREKPWDDFCSGPRSVKSWKEEGGKLAPVVASYDRALRVLADAQQRLAAGRLAGTCRRSVANLRLCRYWFEMSAFHLEALRIYLTELDRFMPPGADESSILITYTSAIKMSDCLDAYDGRTISVEDERRYGHFDGAMPGGKNLRGYQGNFLATPLDDPNYRAKRDLDFVLFHLDPRLLPRANRMIDAARDVMAHEARSGWGWVVYYSEAFTFIWEPVPKGDGIGDRFGNPVDPVPPPHTPSGGGGPGTPK